MILQKIEKTAVSTQYKPVNAIEMLRVIFSFSEDASFVYYKK